MVMREGGKKGDGWGRMGRRIKEAQWEAWVEEEEEEEEEKEEEEEEEEKEEEEERGVGGICYVLGWKERIDGDESLKGGRG